MSTPPTCGICDCCADCAACSDGSGGYDIDMTLTDADLPVFPACRNPATGSTAVSGTKMVAPCPNMSGFDKSDCSAEYNPTGRVRFRVINNSSKCLKVQFAFQISGIQKDADCHLEGEANCNGVPFDYGGNTSGRISWFYVCLCQGATVTGSMNHRIKGCTYPCCFEEALLSDWRRVIYCVDGINCPWGGCDAFFEGVCTCPVCQT